MPYLVTGGTGFVGSYVTRDLARAGEYVVVYDAAPNPGLIAKLLSPDAMSRVTVVRGDITDLGQLLHTLQEHRINRMIHLAALLGAGTNANPSLSVRVNCLGTNTVFEGARLHGIPKVVWGSSTGVFGPHSLNASGMIANDAPHDPQTLYNACKAFNERQAAHYAEHCGLDLIGMRFTAMYGFGKAASLALGTAAGYLIEMIDKPALGLTSSVPLGDSTLDWLHIEDAARAVILADKVAKTASPAFNICGETRSFRDVVAYVRSLLPAAQIALEPGMHRNSERTNFDGSAAEAELGFRAQYTMEQGVKKTIDDLRKDASLPPVG